MERTCPSCGYQRAFCQCGRKKNTTGESVKFQNYQDYTHDTDNYAMTSKIRRRQDKIEKKFQQHLNPVNNESVYTWIDRTETMVDTLLKYSHAQHLWETSKGQWACHRTSLYCFICTSNQIIEMYRMMSHALQDRVDISKLVWYVDELGDDSRTYTIS